MDTRVHQCLGEDLHRRTIAKDQKLKPRQPTRDEIQLKNEIEAKLSLKETTIKSELRKLEDKIKEKSKQLRTQKSQQKTLTAKERRAQLLDRDYQKYKDRNVDDLYEEARYYFQKDDSKWYRQGLDSMMEEGRKFHEWKERVDKLTEKQYNKERYGKPKIDTKLNPAAQKEKEAYRVKSPELQNKMKDSVLSPERDKERFLAMKQALKDSLAAEYALYKPHQAPTYATHASFFKPPYEQRNPELLISQNMAKPQLKEVMRESPKNFRRYLEDGAPIYDKEHPKYSIDQSTRQVIDYKTKLRLEKAAASAQNQQHSPHSTFSKANKSVYSDKRSSIISVASSKKKKDEKQFECTPDGKVVHFHDFNLYKKVNDDKHLQIMEIQRRSQIINERIRQTNCSQIYASIDQSEEKRKRSAQSRGSDLKYLPPKQQISQVSLIIGTPIKKITYSPAKERLTLPLPPQYHHPSISPRRRYENETTNTHHRLKQMQQYSGGKATFHKQ